jgi:serine/threonine-protein phosphatase 2A activator
LYDISAVPYWAKINQGMIKMDKVEVLGKFPVIQYFLIGDVLFTLDEA